MPTRARPQDGDDAGRKWLPGRGPGTRDAAYYVEPGEPEPAVRPTWYAIEYLVARVPAQTLGELHRELLKRTRHSAVLKLVEDELSRR